MSIAKAKDLLDRNELHGPIVRNERHSPLGVQGNEGKKTLDASQEGAIYNGQEDCEESREESHEESRHEEGQEVSGCR